MRILLDGKQVESLVPESLPMLIHGAEGSGASMYTIALAAQWFYQGYRIACLCGYPMAEEKFKELTDRSKGNAGFYTQDKAQDFVQDIAENNDKRIIIIKNIELFDENILSVLDNAKNLIISGDMSRTNLKEKILEKDFVTKVYFSGFDNISTATLAKYEGLVRSGDYEGITTLI